jgi:glycerol kinase
MQFQADISRLPVARAASAEATALGAAFLAGLSVGFWKDRDELSAIIQTSETFTPHMDDKTRAKNLAGWRKAVSAAIYHAYC